jgi:alkanesulfonate monooxygenase SsuD/methylene tetrahydromethanopterin reductase-like flavin-dependent oxidoreductase (luciferase family)
MGLGALFGSEGGPEKIGTLMQTYRETIKTAKSPSGMVNNQAAVMTAGFCHEDPKVVSTRGVELIEWYMEQQRERARLVWQGIDPTTVPADYKGYYERDMRLAAGPHEGEPTPEQVVNKGGSFLVGTPEECIKFVESYEAMGIEQVFSLNAIGPESHEETMNTLKMFGEHVIPYFKNKEKSDRK